MKTLILLALHGSAHATEILYQGNIRGGVAVDASGVDASGLPSDEKAEGDNFEIVIPSTAVITEAFVVLHAKPDGFAASADDVFINGFPLSLASFVSSSETTEVYDLSPPSEFGISGTGSYTYEEDGSADEDFHFGEGLHGASLVVVYEDFNLNGHRHVVIATENVTDGASILDGLAENTTPSAVISYGILNECARDQSNAVTIESEGISFEAGGSDDGSTYAGTCGGQDWNTLITQGSFGIDDTDTIIGVEGDLLDGVPADGTSINSRLDDELYRVEYDRDGELTLGYSDTSEDSQLSLVVAVIELDTDGDEYADAVDNCPDTFNPEQVDSDADGIGDACAGCVDIDGDGYGIGEITTDCLFPDGFDCDDTNPAIHSGAAEIWYDGVDQNCDEASDFDQDGDSHDSAAYGGDDCDDLCELTHPGADEIWYNGEDNACDGGCDYDQDGDACPAAEWYVEAAQDDACDMSCFSDLPVDDGSADDSGIDGETDTGDTGDVSSDTGDTSTDTGGVSDTGDAGDSDATGDTGEPSDTDDATDTGETSLDTGDDTDGSDGDGSDGDGSSTDDTDAVTKSLTDDTGLATDDTGSPEDDSTIEDDCGCDADMDCEPEGTDYFGGDCDDTDNDRYPGNPEVWYDGVDQDCDGNDDDRDGDGEASTEAGGIDCDDDNASINTSAEEIWYDDIDQNCDGNDDDQDGDGEDAAPDGDDCDDLDPNIYSTASEIWYDDIDQNCDGNDDDQDGDGEDAVPAGPDCDDLNDRIYSTAVEVWYDGIDQDCSGTSDYDQDGDGHERRPEGDDCDDLNADVNPSAEEIWEDDVDQNCDGVTELDSDGDGSPDYEDCDPNDASIFPNADGYDGCDEVGPAGSWGLGTGEYKGGGCSHTPSRSPVAVWVFGLMLMGWRRQRA